MTYKRKQLPKYCLHKASGQAYVRIAGDMHYLGKHGSDASRREYDRIMSEFIANGRQPFRHPDEIHVEDLVVRYLDYVEKELNLSKGRKKNIIRVLKTLNDFYGKHPVSAFGPSALKTLRQQWVEKKMGLHTVNCYVSTIKQTFDWGKEEEIIPVDLALAIAAVKQLKRGSTSAVVYGEVKPVSDEIVEKTLPCLRQQMQDMVRVQRFISGRPQDVLNMRLCDIDRSGEIWVYCPFTYKTQKKDAANNRIRKLFIGPKAQAVLLPHLERCEDDPEQFVFTQRNGKQYNINNYGNTIANACKKAGVPHWSPNQLRHAGGTEVRSKFSLEHTDAEKAIAHFEIVKVRFEGTIAADTEAVIALTAAETELTEAIAAEAAAVLVASETPSDMASTALALATERVVAARESVQELRIAAAQPQDVVGQVTAVMNAADRAAFIAESILRSRVHYITENPPADKL